MDASKMIYVFYLISELFTTNLSKNWCFKVCLLQKDTAFVLMTAIWVVKALRFNIFSRYDLMKSFGYFFPSKPNFLLPSFFYFGSFLHLYPQWNTIYIQVLSHFPILSSLLPNLWRLLKNVVVEWIYLKSWAVKYIEFFKRKILNIQ